MNNLIFKKNVSFLLLILLGFIYIIFLLTLSLKILPASMMLVIGLLDSIKHNYEIGYILKSSDTYVTLFVSVIWILLLSRFFLAIFRGLKGLITLKKYLDNANKKNKDNFIIIKSKEKFVFTAGLFTPKIYISSRLFKSLTNEEIKAVLSHEQHHRNEMDPSKMFFCSLLKDTLPFLPAKKVLFDNFEVLTELCADNFAENKLNSRKPVITALLKLVNINDSFHGLAVSSFNLRNDRIKILLGKESYKFRGLLTIALLFTGFLFINSVLVSQTNVFLQCQHIVDCFNALLSNTGSVSLMDKQVCLSSDNYASNYHCIQFAQSHAF